MTLPTAPRSTLRPALVFRILRRIGQQAISEYGTQQDAAQQAKDTRPHQSDIAQAAAIAAKMPAIQAPAFDGSGVISTSGIL